MREKSEAVKSNGGLASLETMVQELPELLQRNKDILDEVSLPNNVQTK
jgi:hypothetical protein